MESGVARAVVYLASDEGSYVADSESFADGGFAQTWGADGSKR